MRKNYGAQHVIVPVHRVDPIEQRDREARIERRFLIAIDQVGPGFQAVALFGIGIAAAQHGAQKIFGDVLIGFEEELVGLSHLADLFVECHFGEQGIRLRIEGRELTRAGLRAGDEAGEHGQAEYCGKTDLNHNSGS